MSNDTHDPQAPGNGDDAPKTDSMKSGATGQRDAAAAEYERQAAETDPASGAQATEPSPVEALQAEVASLKDQLLRAFAEMDNIRKRGERERLDTQKYAVSKFARDMLSVADNLERALAAAPKETADPGFKALVEGLMVTERGLVGTLERHGIKRIPAEGELFDPHLHQAVMEQPDPSVPTGTIVRVFEAGYLIEDRVLRPSSVVVAKGGPKPVKPAAPQAADATSNSSGASEPNATDATNDNAAGGPAEPPSGG